ncbi:amino acid permease/ SLC12A domain-containing protein [Halteromyces radiatus]|uniref:amino acid permease/ SLC12A domain-containing protein n=1 Tax=Halteromyces radiatus TaxID=101107 RepID=UPI00221F147B|nr:amino acid permease/ SLC12A domain-containing protein [Halteromyces radiatus]KAI8086759.1 amino acid permease/ SLC12A domain-containing protein [Halteromyces radiatus]
MNEKIELAEHHEITVDHSSSSQQQQEKIQVFERSSDYASYTSEERRSLQQGTKRGLSARHIQMISLGGSIGTGLFLNSGQNIAVAGPAGALIAYLVIGFMVFCFMVCMGEMATFLPVSGSFNHYATRFVDPAFGFALGWNYWFSWSVTIATELSAAATIINWWKPVMPDAAWSVIFLVIIIAINLVGVRLYGEMEYWMCMIKILIVLVFIIIAILVTSGAVGDHQVIGFKYWSDPGAFVGGAVGTVSVLLSAGFSFQGTEIVGITAGEAKNPTKTVPRAIRNVFWRIIVFYIITIFLIGLCIPATDPNLSNETGDAATASFTLVFKLAGINAGADVINAIILTSVLSAANSDLYTCSRTLLGLARDGNAPMILAKTNKYGSPYWAVIVSSILGFSCVFVSIYSASVGFAWFLSITAVTGFISWWGIAVIHLRFRRAYVKQGRSVADLPYKAIWYPFTPLFAAILCFLIVFGQGYTAFTPTFSVEKFFSNYIGILPFCLCYIIYKIVRRSKVVPLDECDFDTGRVTRMEIEVEDDEEKNLPWYKKALNIIS